MGRVRVQGGVTKENWRRTRIIHLQHIMWNEEDTNLTEPTNLITKANNCKMKKSIHEHTLTSDYYFQVQIF